MKKYLKMARLDHWIKQLFIIPGTVIGIFLIKDGVSFDSNFLLKCILGFFATSCTASANYVINEWLDAEFEGGRHQRRVDLLMEIEERN